MLDKSIMSTIKIKVLVSFQLILVFSLIIISINLPMLLSHNLICQRIPNLTVQQLQICQRSPEILLVIRKGIQMALSECQQLFKNRVQLHPSWNCSNWIQDSLNRLYVNITDIEMKGTKEASFAHALFAAAVVYTLSEACTKSNFPYCTCGIIKSDQTDHLSSLEDNPDIPSIHPSNVAINEEWKWNGCIQNIQFGVEMARLFLDSTEHQMMSPYSLVNLHNNNVGRKIIKDGLTFRCQCHGFSGSCTFRTCWHTISKFRTITQQLYHRYIKAKMVTFSWLNKSFRHKYEKRARSKLTKETKLNKLKHLEKAFINITMFELNQPNLNRMGEMANVKASKRDLIYVKPSINYCQLHRTKRMMENGISQWPTVKQSLSCSVSNQTQQEDALSNENNNGPLQWPPIEPCDKLCCGQRFRSRTYLKAAKCDCVFQFCCSVICKLCNVSITEYECIDG